MPLFAIFKFLSNKSIENIISLHSRDFSSNVNNKGKAMERVAEETLIGEEERIRHDALFYSQCPDDGLLLSGERARSLFIKSKLPLPDLSKIWKLSDTTRDNMLDEGEFVVAMHLIQRRLCGFEIPESIPSHVRPTSRPLLVVAQANEKEIEAYSNIFDWLIQQNEDFLSSNHVLSFLIKSELTTNVLAKIWNLSDIDRNGRINKDELYIAIHLTRFCKNSNSDLAGSIDVLSILPKKSAGESIQDKRRRRTEYQTEIRKLTSLRYKLKSELINAKTSDNMAAKKKIQCELDVVSRQLDSMEEKETVVRDEIYKMNTSTSITTNIEVLRPFDRSFLMKRQLSGVDFLKQLKLNCANQSKFGEVNSEIFLQDNIIDFAQNLPKNLTQNRRNSAKETNENLESNSYSYSSDDESEADEAEIGQRRRKRSKVRQQSDNSTSGRLTSFTKENNKQESEIAHEKTKRSSNIESSFSMDYKSPSQSDSENKVMGPDATTIKDQKESNKKDPSRKRSTSALEIFQKLFSSDSEGSSDKDSQIKTNSKKGLGLQKSPWKQKRNASTSKSSTSEDEKEKTDTKSESIKLTEKARLTESTPEKNVDLIERKNSRESVKNRLESKGSRHVSLDAKNSNTKEGKAIDLNKTGSSSEGDNDVFDDRTAGSFMKLRPIKDSHDDGRKRGEPKMTSKKGAKESKKEIKGDEGISTKEVKEDRAISKKEVKEDRAISKKEAKEDRDISKKEVKAEEAISKKEVKAEEAISKKEIRKDEEGNISKKEVQNKDLKGAQTFSMDLIDMLEETLVDSEGDLGGRDTTEDEEVIEDEITGQVLHHEESERSFEFLDILEESNLDSKEEVLYRAASVEEKGDQNALMQSGQDDDGVSVGVLHAEEIKIADDSHNSDCIEVDSSDIGRKKINIKARKIQAEEEIKPRLSKDASLDDSSEISQDDDSSESDINDEGQRFSDEKITENGLKVGPSENADQESQVIPKNEDVLSESVDHECQKLSKKTKKVLKTKHGQIIRSRSLYGLRSRIEPNRRSFVEECEWLDGLVRLELEALEKKRRAESQSSASDSQWTVIDPFYETWLNSRRVQNEFSRSETIDERALDLASSRALVRGLLDMEIAYRNDSDTDVTLRKKSPRLRRDEEFYERRKSMPVGKDILLAAEAVNKHEDAKAFAENEVAMTENESRVKFNAENSLKEAAVKNSEREFLSKGSRDIDQETSSKGEEVNESKKIEEISSEEIDEKEICEHKNDELKTEEKPLKNIKVFKELFESSTTVRPIDQYKSMSFDVKPRSTELTRSKSVGDSLIRPRQNGEHIAVREKQKSVGLDSRKCIANNDEAKRNNEKKPIYVRDNDQVSPSSPTKTTEKVTIKENKKDIDRTTTKTDIFSPEKPRKYTKELSAMNSEEEFPTKGMADEKYQNKIAAHKPAIPSATKEGYSPDLSDKSEDDKSDTSKDEITMLKSVGAVRQLFEAKPTEDGLQRRSLIKCKSEADGGVSETDVDEKKRIKGRSQSLKQSSKGIKSHYVTETRNEDSIVKLTPTKEHVSQEKKTKHKEKSVNAVETNRIQNVEKEDSSTSNTQKLSDLNNNNNDDDGEHIPSIQDRLALFQTSTVVEAKRETKIGRNRPKSYHGKILVEDGGTREFDLEIKDVNLENKGELKQRKSREKNDNIEEEDGFIRSRSYSEKKRTGDVDKSLITLGEMMLGGDANTSKVNRKSSHGKEGHKISKSPTSMKSESKVECPIEVVNSGDSVFDVGLYRRIVKDDRIKKELEEQQQRDLEIRKQIQLRENSVAKSDTGVSGKARPVSESDDKLVASLNTLDTAGRLDCTGVNLKNTKGSVHKRDDRTLPDYRSVLQNDRVRKEIDEQKQKENELNQPTVDYNAEINGVKEQHPVANKKAESGKLTNQKHVDGVNQKKVELMKDEQSLGSIKNKVTAVNLKTTKMPNKIELELEAERKRELELANERQRRLEEQDEILKKEKIRLEIIEAEKIRIAEEEDAMKNKIVEEKMKRQARTRGLRAMFETT